MREKDFTAVLRVLIVDRSNANSKIRAGGKGGMDQQLRLLNAATPPGRRSVDPGGHVFWGKADI